MKEERYTDVINISRIKVAGIGGLGLVAMAGIVAWNLQPIRMAMAIALIAGVVIAVSLIVWRR